MEQNDYPEFLDWLSDLAACFCTTPALDRAAQQYFADLQPFDLAIVRETLRTARQNCHFFPTIAELRELAKNIGRARFEAERHQQTQHKLIAYEEDARASGLSPAEIQARIAELLAVVSDGMRLDAVTHAEPREPPRQLHEAYRIPTTDDAARKRLLHAQLARLKPDMALGGPSARMAPLSLDPSEERGMESP
jgi:hypothetical protein